MSRKSVPTANTNSASAYSNSRPRGGAILRETGATRCIKSAYPGPSINSVRVEFERLRAAGEKPPRHTRIE